MFRKWLQTPNDHLLALIRFTVGIVFFAHGAQKVLGWFGGQGWSASVNGLTHTFGLPEFLSIIVVLTEFVGGIGLILGLLSRIAALGIAIEMLVAIFLVHAANGFFMNWFGNQKGEGFEYHLLVIAMSILVTVRGAGALSIDRVLAGATGTRRVPSGFPEPHLSRG